VIARLVDAILPGTIPLVVLLFIVGYERIEVWWQRRRRRRHRARSSYEHYLVERYLANQAIRDIKRRAIRQMMDVEAIYREVEHDPEVIEGTAVEVRQ